MAVHPTMAATVVAMGAWSCEITSVQNPATVASRMAVGRRSRWGVGWSRTKEGCGMVVKQEVSPSLYVFGMALGYTNLASAGPCEVSVLLVVDNVELTAEILE